MPINFLQEVNISDFLEVEGNVKIDSTGYLQLPLGTTAQRPASPQKGMIRYNSSDDVVEVYARGPEGNAWRSLAFSE